MPPKPPYSWVLSEPYCSVAGVGGVSSSVWRPSLSGFTPPSVIANGASSLPVSSTPQAGQWGSTGTSDGPAIVGRDPDLPRAPSGASISSTHLFRKSWRVAALGQTLPSDGRTADDRCAGSERKPVSKVTRFRSTPQADLTAVVRWRPGSTLSGP